MVSLAALFGDPPAAYRPMIFWLWNGDLTAEGIRAAVANFAARGCGGFFIHPMGEDFRLADFRRGMSPAYLSEEYFSLVRVAVEAAAEHGLYAWLYDEGGWPSGNAQGAVVAGHPEFARQRLVARRLPAADAMDLPPDTVAVVGLPDMGIPQAVESRDAAHALTPHPEVIIFSVESDPHFADVLSTAAVGRFIEVTHERFAAAVGDHFGRTIPGIFTDETPLGGQVGTRAIPWTHGLLEKLNRQTAVDFTPYLALLFGPEAVGEDLHSRFAEHERLAARCEYYEVLTRQFQEAYWDQIAAWCQAHGLLHTGHVGGEDNLPDHIHFGHFFRTAGRLDAPGVDAIWRQVYPGQDNFPFPGLARSAMNQRPAPGDGPLAGLVPTESNAVYAYGLDYDAMRWVADYQFQSGANLYAPMACYYTTADGRLYGTMSHFGPGMPLWEQYEAFAGYIGRQCLLARHTDGDASWAVYYPIESVWADAATGQAAWESLQKLARLFQECQTAFDFIAGDGLVDGLVTAGALTLGQSTYRNFVVPRSMAMSGPALAQLARLRAAGARVVFLEHFPPHAAELDGRAGYAQAIESLVQCEALVCPFEQFAALLYDECAVPGPLRLTDPCPDLLLSARRADRAWVYLATNNTGEVLRLNFAVHPSGPTRLETWDLRDGERVVLATTAQPLDFTPALPPWASEVFVVREEGAAAEELLQEPCHAPLADWLAQPAAQRPLPIPEVDVLAEYTEAANIAILTEATVTAQGLETVTDNETSHPYTQGPAPLLSWAEWGLETFSGRIAYTFDLAIAEAFVNRRLLLDLGEVHAAAEVRVNGVKIADSLWHPHTVDLAGMVRPGANELTVIVANTLAPTITAPGVMAEASARGWHNTYWQRALPMMADVTSGLLGPVRVLMLRPTQAG